MFRLYILTREIRGSEKEIPGHKISFMLVKMVFLGELKVLAVFNKLQNVCAYHKTLKTLVSCNYEEHRYFTIHLPPFRKRF
jgi:hypothetical protein